MANFNSNSVSQYKRIITKINRFLDSDIPIIALEIALGIIACVLIGLASAKIDLLEESVSEAKKATTTASESVTKSITYEKYSKKLYELDTTEEYQLLCKKLAEYAGCDNAYIGSVPAKMVVNIDGEYVATNISTNIYWIVTEKSYEVDSEASMGTEDIGVFYAEYCCTDSSVPLNHIAPPNCVTQACRLTTEIETSLGYTTEEIIKIYNTRYNVESNRFTHEKFKTKLVKN